MSNQTDRWKGKLQQLYTEFLDTLEDERVGWELSHDEFHNFLKQEFDKRKVSDSWDDLYQDRYPEPDPEEGVTENGPYFGAY